VKVIEHSACGYGTDAFRGEELFGSDEKGSNVENVEKPN
jgi:hypothetical protein